MSLLGKTCSLLRQRSVTWPAKPEDNRHKLERVFALFGSSVPVLFSSASSISNLVYSLRLFSFSLVLFMKYEYYNSRSEHYYSGTSTERFFFLKILSVWKEIRGCMRYYYASVEVRKQKYKMAKVWWQILEKNAEINHHHCWMSWTHRSTSSQRPVLRRTFPGANSTQLEFLDCP